MPTEFLSLCIPTRNRAWLLRDLLRSIAREIRSGSLAPTDVRTYVFDNASTDDTKAVFAEETRTLKGYFEYSRHPKNIGAAGNQLLCARTGAGRYRWVIGDDEVLGQGALPYLLNVLHDEAPAWILVSDGGLYGRGLRPPRWYSDVREFVHVANRDDPETLMTAGCWSMNVFRSDCFDHELAGRHAGTSTYPHFFGMMRAFNERGGRVFFADRAVVLFRERRPAPPDNQLPANSDLNWRRCLQWLRDEFNEPDIDLESQSKAVSRRMIQNALHHPWRTVWNHSRLLLIPGTWIRAVRRIWYYIR